MENPPKVTDEAITKFISNPQDIKLGQFTQEELDVVRRKFKNSKAAGLDETPPELWKTRKFDKILLRYCNTKDRWTKSFILPFLKEDDLRIAKNYRGITITSIAVKIYNALIFNRIEPEIEKVLRKNQNAFQRNRSTSQILTIRRILDVVRAKKQEVALLFVDFSIHGEKIK